MKKVTAFIGSPRKNGVTSQIIENMKIDSTNVEFKTVHLYDKNLNGCRACGYCKTETKTAYCSIKDDMLEMYKMLEDSDYIIFGSPIYFGTFTGVSKLFIDRMYALITEDFKASTLKNKKIITVTTSGAKEKVYCMPTSKFYVDWFKDFFGMDVIEQINAGGFMSDNEILPDDHDAIIEAKRIAKKILSD